jgi:hypothetical protein
MKKYLLTAICICLIYNIVEAQNCSIALAPVTDTEFTNIPASAESFLESKLTRIITENDGNVGYANGPLCLLAKFNLLEKDIVGGAPAVISQRLNITFYIANIVDRKVIASTDVEVQAAGQSDAQLYTAAIRQLNPQNKKLRAFMAAGREKALAYYDNNADAIIKRAQQLASMKDYEEALYLLTGAPECSKSIDKYMNACRPVFQAYIDDRCHEYLIKAQTVWAAAQNSEGARKAGVFLTEIYPEASCYGEAAKLLEEMRNRIGEEWDLKLRRYDDSVSLEKQRINAWREVGSAFGKGQQPVTTNLMWVR